MTGEHIFLNKVCLSKRLASLIGLCICVYLMLRLEMFSLKQILLICFCVVNIIDLLICAGEKITHNVREMKRLSKTYGNLHSRLGQKATILLFTVLSVLTLAIRIVVPFIIYFI